MSTAIAEALAASPNPFAIAIPRYARAPVAFVREVLGAEPDPWQLEALRALSRGETRLSIRSGHGVGKSTFASWVIIWFVCTRAPHKVGVTAPSAPQLFDALWAEMKSWLTRLPEAWRDLFDVTSDRVTLKADPDGCFVTARTARPDKPEALAGLHSLHLLFVVDEASGVDEAVFESAGGSMSTAGAITVLLGNPTRSTGHFWRTHNLERERWWTWRVSSADSPRVTKDYVEEVRNRWGEASNQYRVRVLGEFPLADDDTVIPGVLVDEAMARSAIPDATAELWGVDVARFGSDASVLIKRRGWIVPEMPRRWRGIDLMALAGAIKAEYDITKGSGSRPALIVVDSIGLGAGVVDRLAEQHVPVVGVNVAEAASAAGRFARLRDELWIRAREWLESKRCQLPRDDALRADLVAPRMKYLSDGKLQVESKVALRSRGFASPDSADAFCLTFAPAGVALAGQGFEGLNDQTPVRAFVRGMQ